jgi:hypothetical protein
MIRSVARAASMIVSLVLSCGVSSVAAPEIPAVSSTFCGSSATTSSIVQAIVPPLRSIKVLAALASTEVQLKISGDAFAVRRGDASGVKIVPAVVPTAPICLSYPPDAVLLETATHVSGAVFAAVSAASDYRAKLAWPGSHPAHPMFPGTTVYVETRGRYQNVTFVDDPQLIRSWDSCFGQEYYRVDPATFSVLPYNGCLIGGSEIQLPRLNELPG